MNWSKPVKTWENVRSRDQFTSRDDSALFPNEGGIFLNKSSKIKEVLTEQTNVILVNVAGRDFREM